jgi:hypothetical protein
MWARRGAGWRGSVRSANAGHVLVYEADELQAATEGPQEGHLATGTAPGVEHVADLGDHGWGNQQFLVARAQQRCCLSVEVVGWSCGCYEDVRVNKDHYRPKPSARYSSVRAARSDGPPCTEPMKRQVVRHWVPDNDSAVGRTHRDGLGRVADRHADALAGPQVADVAAYLSSQFCVIVGDHQVPAFGGAHRPNGFG